MWVLSLFFAAKDADLKGLIERDPDAAIPVLKALSEQNAIARPWVQYTLLKAYLKKGEADSAEALLSGLETPQLRYALERLFEHHLSKGNYRRVIALSDRYPKIVGGRPVLLWQRAQAEKATGMTERYRKTLYEIVDAFPSSVYAEKAIETGGFSADDRAIVLYNRGRYKEAVSVFKKAKPISGLAYHAYFMSLYRTKDYSGAVSLYEREGIRKLGGRYSNEIYLYAGISYNRLGMPDQAISALIMVDEDMAERAIAEASFVILERGCPSRYQDVVSAFGKTRDPDALLRLGLLAFALGEMGDAEAFLKRALENSPSVGTEGACYYWLWRTTGDGLWKARLLSVDPLSWYGLMVRPWIPISERDPCSWAGIGCDPEAGEAVRIMTRLGLADEAYGLLKDKPETWWVGGKALASAGDFLAASRLFTEIYRRAPKRDTLPEELLRAMYPLLYWNEIKQAADSAGIEPALLISIVREESRFRPDAISPVGAKGLAQLMNYTARRLADSLGIRYNIFDVNDNLYLGAVHLRERLNDFGKEYLAVAAYNAGPQPVRRWMGFMEGWPPDLFCEFITYQETRNYTKNVMKSYWIYKWLISEQ
ncbi:MAG: transglycosylase SLT domain-containing protein [candidate division WOR-3 bacterium]